MPDGLLRIPPILKRGVSDVVSVFDAFGVGIYCVDLDGRFTYINPAGRELLGWDTEELIGSDAHEAVHHARPDGSPFPRAQCQLHRTVVSGSYGRSADDLFWRKDGSPLEVALTIAPLHEGGERVGAIVVFADAGWRRRDAELLRSRASQQSTLVEVGLLALGGGSLQALLEQATVVVAKTLDVELAQAFELDPRAGCLRLRAGVGLRAGLVGRATVEMGRGSLAGFTVTRDAPVVVEDLRTERRFRPPRGCLGSR